MRTIALAFALAGCGTALAAEPTGTAVEYYNTTLRHYFITASPGEMQVVESGGAGPGWVRTGGQFGVFRDPADAPSLSPVCRFYAPGPNSHFYTADPGDCEYVKTLGGWIYEGVAFYVERPVNGACGAGTTPVYRTYNNGFARNDSNHRFTVDATVYSRAGSLGHAPEGVAMCAALSSADRRADAVRLLRQASFGPTPAEVDRVVAMGVPAWVDEQLALPPTRYPDYPWVDDRRPQSCVDDRSQPARPDSYCNRDNYTLFSLQVKFFANALANPDQLRARVAFALSQIMVTSGMAVSRNYAMRHYQQMLYDRALGNFYDLLLAVTLSPVMGDYLDMANNNKSDAVRGTDPNENYAREVLQLFSVGTYLLNPDGTQQLDASGKARFTYDQAAVKGFSRVFTGWTYPTVAGAQPRNNNPRNYLGDMRPVEANHETGTKPLLGGTLAPAGMTMQDDLAFAHRNIFQHPNVGPFIGKQLIQKLVTSEPSPAYVARVTAAIRPAAEEGEQPLLPVLHDMAGIGSTDITPFLTVKPCVPTLKSHLSKAVVDSGWERQVAIALDESSHVRAWVKNAKLSFTIPYEHQGRRHEFIPDFVVALRDARGEPSDEHLVVEVKGLEREADRSKDVGAQRWMAAVNHWGKLGRWRYAKIHSPHDLVSVLNGDPGPS